VTTSQFSNLIVQFSPSAFKYDEAIFTNTLG